MDLHCQVQNNHEKLQAIDGNILYQNNQEYSESADLRQCGSCPYSDPDANNFQYLMRTFFLVQRYIYVEIFTRIRSSILRDVANRQTDRQTMKQTDHSRVLHSLLAKVTYTQHLTCVSSDDELWSAARYGNVSMTTSDTSWISSDRYGGVCSFRQIAPAAIAYGTVHGRWHVSQRGVAVVQPVY